MEELSINDNKITTKGINSLTSLTGLATLECKGNGMIDSDVIPAFAKMRNLTKLTLGKRLSADPELESKLPPQCELLD
jgi:Leucine-rich repeat (LRR) protein